MAAAFIDSYDPRVWAAAWTPPAAPARSSRRLPIAVAAGCALALAGVALAWFALPSDDAPKQPTAAGQAAPSAADAPVRTRRTLVLSGAGDLTGALRAAGLAPAEADAVAQAAMPGLRAQGTIRAVLTFSRADGGVRLERLEASNSDSSGVVVNRAADGRLASTRVAAQVSTRIVTRHGTMDGDSFYSSAVAVGIPNSVIPAFAKALAFDFDFQREVAAGDAFEAAYAQRVNASGEAMGVPELLYASLTTAAKSAAVYRFAPDGRTDEWFDASGRSIVRSLMRTPVDGARVTSKFGMRFHPVLKFAKLHGGIDFAAPTGTPIFAAGSGVLEFVGPRGANGNFISLRHDNGWRTLYLHLHRFAPGMAAGTRVSQGQVIGEVGTTGRSTGPHLHYEVHIDGEKIDPLTVRTESGRTLEGAQLVAFAQARDRIDVSRAAAAD